MIKKLKNWWISVMPSIGPAPMVEDEVKLRDEFYKLYPQFAGVLEMHEARSVSWLEAMMAVRFFNCFKAGYEFGKNRK